MQIFNPFRIIFGLIVLNNKISSIALLKADTNNAATRQVINPQNSLVRKSPYYFPYQYDYYNPYYYGAGYYDPYYDTPNHYYENEQFVPKIKKPVYYYPYYPEKKCQKQPKSKPVYLDHLYNQNNRDFMDHELVAAKNNKYVQNDSKKSTNAAVYNNNEEKHYKNKNENQFVENKDLDSASNNINKAAHVIKN